DGEVLVVQSGNPAVGDTNSRILNPFAFPSPSPSPAPSPKPGVWRSFPSTISAHALGSSVLFDSGSKVLVLRGFNCATNPIDKVEFTDLKAGSPTWNSALPMNLPRAYHTTTVLPDGKVLVTGGVTCSGIIDVTCGSALNAEMWDPTSNPFDIAHIPWKTMAAE